MKNLIKHLLRKRYIVRYYSTILEKWYDYKEFRWLCHAKQKTRNLIQHNNSIRILAIYSLKNNKMVLYMKKNKNGKILAI